MSSECKCPGCCRPELHKICPAYGTAYYMSGIPYDISAKELFDFVCSDNEDISIAAQKILAEALSKPLYTPFLEPIPNPQSVEHLQVTTPLGREKLQELGRKHD